MILMRAVTGAMRFDHNKLMSTHVFTYSTYNFNALTPVVWKLWR